MLFSIKRRLLRVSRFLAKTPPLYPFFFGAYPVLALYSLNVDQLWFPVLKEFLVQVWLAVLIVWIVAGALYRDKRKGAVLTAVATFIFFTYGYGVDLATALFGYMREIRYALLLPIALFFSWVMTRLRRGGSSQQQTITLNVVGGLLVLFPSISIATYYATHHSLKLPPTVGDQTKSAAPQSSLEKPDIYFIVLDAYAREDVVKNLFHYDNSWFINALRSRGFQVSNESRSNYSITFLSLAATLNLTYLDDVVEEFRRTSVDRDTPTAMIRNNRVQTVFKEQGYKIVHFASGWAVTDQNPYADVYRGSHSFEEYRSILYRSTALGVLFPNQLNNGWRGLVFDNLRGLGEVASLPGPKFVFAHFVCPHEPFVFYPDGSDPRLDFNKEGYRQRWTKKRRYLDNLIFISRRIVPVIDAIIKNSPREPLIILESDHGPSTLGFTPNPSIAQKHERLSNLVAMRLPGKPSPKVADDFTPVNTFRFIFDQYFGTSYGLLANRSFYCDPATPYHLIDVNSCCADKDNPFLGLNADTSMADADQDRSDTLTLKRK